MQSSIGQCVALVTYAQAVLNGYAAVLDWKTNPWFAYTADYRFGVGEPGGGPSQGGDPNEWFEKLREQGFRKAALFAEPYNGDWNTIMMLGFAGGQRMAPVTTNAQGSVVWHERPKFDKEKQAWHNYRGGFRVMPGQDRVLATPEEAGEALGKALTDLIDFQRRHRPADHPFAEMFAKGQRLLQGTERSDTEILDRVRPPFPYPDQKRLTLVAAVEAAWAFGGMGWWNDWSSSDPDVDAEYKKATIAYYEAMVACLVAACEPD